MTQGHDAILLIPAAGRGRRMGGGENKIYLSLAGKPLLAHTLAAFLQSGLFSQVIMIVAPGEEEILRRRVLSPFFSGRGQVVLLVGGRERQHSVFNGLQYLHRLETPADTLICIHDAARPLVSDQVIRGVLREALVTGSAVAGISLKDTVKEVDSQGMVRQTPPRNSLRAIQTPQCFKFSLLWAAYCRAAAENFLGSDDASLVERTGAGVKIVPGDEANFKITTPGDLQAAEAYLAARKNSGVL